MKKLKNPNNFATVCATVLFALIILMASFSKGQSITGDSTKVKASQCLAICKSGNQCSRLTKNVSGVCFQHDAMKKAGKDVKTVK